MAPGSTPLFSPEPDKQSEAVAAPVPELRDCRTPDRDTITTLLSGPITDRAALTMTRSPGEGTLRYDFIILDSEHKPRNAGFTFSPIPSRLTNVLDPDRVAALPPRERIQFLNSIFHQHLSHLAEKGGEPFSIAPIGPDALSEWPGAVSSSGSRTVRTFYQPPSFWSWLDRGQDYTAHIAAADGARILIELASFQRGSVIRTMRVESDHLQLAEYVRPGTVLTFPRDDRRTPAEIIDHSWLLCQRLTAEGVRVERFISLLKDENPVIAGTVPVLEGRSGFARGVRSAPFFSDLIEFQEPDNSETPPVAITSPSRLPYRHRPQIERVDLVPGGFLELRRRHDVPIEIRSARRVDAQGIEFVPRPKIERLPSEEIEDLFIKLASSHLDSRRYAIHQLCGRGYTPQWAPHRSLNTVLDFIDQQVFYQADFQKVLCLRPQPGTRAGDAAVSALLAGREELLLTREATGNEEVHQMRLSLDAAGSGLVRMESADRWSIEFTLDNSHLNDTAGMLEVYQWRDRLEEFADSPLQLMTQLAEVAVDISCSYPGEVDAAFVGAYRLYHSLFTLDRSRRGMMQRPMCDLLPRDYRNFWNDERGHFFEARLYGNDGATMSLLLGNRGIIAATITSPHSQWPYGRKPADEPLKLELPRAFDTDFERAEQDIAALHSAFLRFDPWRESIAESDVGMELIALCRAGGF